MLLRLLVLGWSSSAAVALPGRSSANGTSEIKLNQPSLASVLTQPSGTPYRNTTAVSISSLAPDPAPASEIWLRSVSTALSMQALPATVSPAVLTTPALASSNSTLSTALSATKPSSNATCTIQIPNASVGWWYPATFSHKMGTFTTSANNFSRIDSVTLLTSTATFNVPSAIESDWVCTMSETYFAEWDATITQCDDYTDKPTAAATSVAYRKAASAPLPSDNVVPMSDLWMYDFGGLELPSATTTISAAPNVTITETSATPFVHFTAYEVVYNNRTETVQLPSAHVYPYWLKGTNSSTAVSGLVPNEFLRQIPQSDCDGGQLQATVTVVIVVDLYYENRPNFDPFIVHFESSALGWEDDPPVLVQDHGSRPPTFMTDWEIPDLNQPTPPARPQLRPDSGPTTRDSRVQAQDTPQTVGAIGSEAIILGPLGVVVGSQTLRLGSAITVAGTPVAILPSPTALVIGGTTTLLPKPADPTVRQTVGTIGTHPIILGPSSVIVVGSQTIQHGAPITVDVDGGGGVSVSFAPEATALVVGSVTSLLPAPNRISPAPPMLTIGSSIFTPDAATQYFLDPGQTLTPGGTAMLDGTRISLGPAASFVVIGATTQRLSPPAIALQMVVGSMTFTPLPAGPSGVPKPISRFLVDGQTLIAGGPAVTIRGAPTVSTPPTTLSLAPSAIILLVNGTPTPLSSLPTPSPVLALGTATTLTPGGAVTIAGTTVELADGASAVRWGVQGVWETGVVGGQRGEAAGEGEGGGAGGGDGGRVGASPTGLRPSSAAGGYGRRCCGVGAVAGSVFIAVLLVL